MQEEIEGQGIRQHLPLRSAAIQHSLRQRFQLFHGTGAGAAGGLIRAHHHAAHRPLRCQGSQGEGEQDRGAVGICNHTLMLKGCLGVDLRNHQRDTLLHPKGAGVVDHHGSGVGDRITPALRYRSSSRSQHQINTLKRVGRHFFDRERESVPALGLSSGASRSQELQFRNRKIALLKQNQQFLPNGTTGTKNSNVERTVRKRRSQTMG